MLRHFSVCVGVCPEHDNRLFHKGPGPSSTLGLRLHAGCPWKDLHLCVSFRFFSSSLSLPFISLPPFSALFAINAIHFKRLYWLSPTYMFFSATINSYFSILKKLPTQHPSSSLFSIISSHFSFSNVLSSSPCFYLSLSSTQTHTHILVPIKSSGDIYISC